MRHRSRCFKRPPAVSLKYPLSLLLFFCTKCALALGELGLGTKLSTLLVNVPGCWNAKDVQTRQDSNTFMSPDIEKQGSCNVDCRTCNHGSSKTIGCVDRGCKLRVRNRDIGKESHDDPKHSNTERNNTNHGNNPVDVSIMSPGENEEADGSQNRAGKSGNQTLLVVVEAVLDVIGDHVVAQEEEVEECANSGTDTAALENQADFSKIEAVDGFEDERENFEEAEEDAVEEGGIQVDIGNSRIFDGNLKRPDKSLHQNAGRRHTTLVKFALRLESGIAGKGSKALRTSKQNVGRGCLWRKEEKHQQHGR